MVTKVGNQSSHKNSNSHIDASHSRQPLVKGERLVRYEVNAVMTLAGLAYRSHADRGVQHRRMKGLGQTFAQGHMARCASAILLARFSIRVTFAGSIQSPIASRGAG